MTRRVIAIVAAALVLASLFLIAGRSAWQAHVLRSAAADVPFRTLAGRLGGLPHRQLRQLRGERGNADLLPLLGRAGELAKKTTDDHMRGKALLLLGETDRAVEQLHRAAANGAADASSDLAAALLQQGVELGSAELLLDAAATAKRAITLDGTHAPAHFNLGVALDELGLTTEAQRAFDDAARFDEGSDWAAEARERAQRNRSADLMAEWTAMESRVSAGDFEAARRAIARDSAPARRFAEGPYLVGWATARIAGDAVKAEQSLRLARTVARALREVRGEKLLDDAIAAIDRAELRGSALELARTHVTYGDARLALRDRDATRALAKFDEAAKAFDRYGSPMALLARYFAASALYNQARIDETLAKIAGIERLDPEGRDYHALAAQLGWEQGICLIVRGRYSDALEVFEHSRSIASAVGDATLGAQFDSLAAEALEYLGRTTEAWHVRARALRAFSALRNDQRKAVTLMTAANLQLSRREWKRTIVLLEYAIPLAVRLGDAVLASQALAQRAIAYEELGDRAAGASDRDRAAVWLQKIAEPSVHARLAVELEIARGVATRVRSPRDAIDHFTHAIDEFLANGEQAHLPRLYLERGRAHEALGERDVYRTDLMSALDTIDSWRAGIQDIDTRAALNIWGETITRDAVDLELRAGDIAAAFADVERARTLHTGANLAALGSALASDAAIVEYASTPRGMIAFVIRRDRAHAVLLSSPIERISAAADAYRSSAEGAPAALETLVIAPIRPLLRGVVTLLVVPERELSGIPFGALYDDARRRFLVEDMSILHAPSTTKALACSLRPAARVDRVLVIGANEFDLSSAAALPAVEREAVSVAKLWRTATLLKGADATPDALRREMPRASIIHFAGHIIGHASGARLLLSSGSLSISDVARLPLDGSRLVVLSACHGAEKKTTYAITSDVASAFLVAGAPAVIASAADLDDAGAPAVMARVHSLLLQGRDAAEAVRESAIVERQEAPGVPPSARLMVIGGSTRLLAATRQDPGV